MLNEIKSSNLDKLNSMSLVEGARDFPEETLRLLIKEFRKSNIQIDEYEKLFKRISSSDSLDDLNKWFDKNFHYDYKLKMDNKSIKIRRFYINEGIFHFDTNIFEYKTKATNSISNIFSDLTSKFSKIFKKITASSIYNMSPSDYEKLNKYLDSITERDTSFNKTESLLKKYADKFSLLLVVRREKKYKQISIYPKCIPLQIADQLDTNLVNKLNRFNYKQQYENLKKFIPYFIKIINKNNYVFEGPNPGAGFVWFKIKDNGHNEYNENVIDELMAMADDDYKLPYRKIIKSLFD